ncbi:MAG TPA: hypothetical protein VJ831_12410 [Jatrophihabitantaceae bacterium]|nr:hypothetical protein [Jatrophihabitantaceae bacterium]
MVALVLFGLLLIAGIAGVRGWLPDTRDPEFGLGRIISPQRNRAPQPSGR